MRLAGLTSSRYCRFMGGGVICRLIFEKKGMNNNGRIYKHCTADRGSKR